MSCKRTIAMLRPCGGMRSFLEMQNLCRDTETFHAVSHGRKADEGGHAVAFEQQWRADVLQFLIGERAMGGQVFIAAAVNLGGGREDDGRMDEQIVGIERSTAPAREPDAC